MKLARLAGFAQFRKVEALIVGRFIIRKGKTILQGPANKSFQESLSNQFQRAMWRDQVDRVEIAQHSTYWQEGVEIGTYL